MPLWKSIKQWRAHLPSLPHADPERLRQGAKQQVIFCVYNLEAIDDSRGYNKCDTAQKYGGVGCQSCVQAVRSADVVQLMWSV